MDGGTVEDVNAYSAITQCMEIVEDPADIIVDVTICSPHTGPKPEDQPSQGVQGNLQRSKNIRNYYTGTDSISQAMRAYPDVEWRYLFLEMNGAANIFDFRNVTTWPLQEEGRQDAKNMLDVSERGFDGFQLLKDWDLDFMDVRAKYDTWADYYIDVLDQYLRGEK